MSVANFLAQLVNVTCNKCQYKLSGDDFMKAHTQIEAGILVCPQCQSLISAGVTRQSPTGVDKSTYRPTGAISYNQIQSNEILFLTPWKSPISVFILFFGLFWSAITMPIFFMVTRDGRSTTNMPPTFLGVLFVLIGVSLTAGGVISFVNRRKIKVNGQGISYSDGPLWSSKPTQFLRQDIKNLRVRTYSNGTINDKPVYQYAVEVCMNSGQMKKLCSTNVQSDAIFIEYSIEKFLALKDDQTLDRVGFGGF